MSDSVQRQIDDLRIREGRAKYMSGFDYAIELQEEINALCVALEAARNKLDLVQQINREADAELNNLKTPSYDKYRKAGHEVTIFGFEPTGGAYSLNTLTQIR